MIIKVKEETISTSSLNFFKFQNRRRQPSLLESSLLGSVQDSNLNNRQNHLQKNSTKTNIPHYSNPFCSQSSLNRPNTPTSNRKRKFSPSKVVNSISNKDSSVESDSKQIKKKSVKEDLDSYNTPLVPKVEVNDFDDNDSNYSEQESGMIDVSQLLEKNTEKESVELFSTNSRDSPYPAIKTEGVPASEIGKHK